MIATRNRLPALILSTCLFFLTGLIPAQAENRDITIAMPEEILLQTIRSALPIPIESTSRHMTGDLFVDSLENLLVKEKSIFLQGVVAGRDLAMKTNFGGQDISMKLGNMRLPVTCELFFRFDKQSRSLFITPKFPEAEANDDNPAAVLLPMLTSLGGSEYLVEFDSIQPYLAQAGGRPLSGPMDPVDIRAVKGILHVTMRPRVL